MGRMVTALVTSGDVYVGAVGPFAVDVPWWAEIGPVAEYLEGVLGGPVTVLRLVAVENGGDARDGHVTYHAEFPGPATGTGAVPAGLAAAASGRAAWATARGVREALDWAEEALRAAGRRAVGTARQVKTWNLAALWRIPTDRGPVWLKITPEFAADEGAVIRAFAEVDPSLVPPVVASDPRNHRVLLDHVPGKDCWNADAAVIRDAVSRFVAAQAAATPPPGLRRRTPKDLAGHIARLLDGEAGSQLTADERGQAWRFVEALPDLVAELDACGLPETLVHGDFHTGNWRSDGGPAVVVDFADAHVGHPVMDGVRPGLTLPPEPFAVAAEAWIGAWRTHAPGSDPARALKLAEPIQHLMYAVVYQEFLDGIETSERVYHEGDPASCIRASLTARVV